MILKSLFAALAIALLPLAPPYIQILPAMSIRPDARCEPPLPPNEIYSSEMRLVGPLSVISYKQYTITVTIKNTGCLPIGLFYMGMTATSETGAQSHRRWVIYKGLGPGGVLTDSQVLTAPLAFTITFPLTVTAGGLFEVTYPDYHFGNGYGSAPPIVVYIDPYPYPDPNPRD